MRIAKCDICGKSDQDEKTYIRQYRRAIFIDGYYSKENQRYGKIVKGATNL